MHWGSWPLGPQRGQVPDPEPFDPRPHPPTALAAAATCVPRLMARISVAARRRQRHLSRGRRAVRPCPQNAPRHSLPLEETTSADRTGRDAQARSHNGQAEALDELSGRQRRAIMAAGGIKPLLAAAALLDLRRRPGDQVRGSKKLWAAAAFMNFVGPLAYFAFGRRRC